MLAWKNRDRTRVMEDEGEQSTAEPSPQQRGRPERRVRMPPNTDDTVWLFVKEAFGQDGPEEPPVGVRARSWCGCSVAQS